MGEDEVIKRLEKFEEKLDRVADALFALTRIEERQSNTVKTLERVWSSVEVQDARISAVEKKQGSILTAQVMWGVIVFLTGVIGFLLKGAA